MRRITACLLGPFWVLGAALATAGEPSINEMLTEAKEMSSAPEPEPDKPGDPNAVVEDDDFIRGIKARLPRELFTLDKSYGNDIRRRAELYFDLQKYREALEHYTRYTRGRGWHVENGFAHGGLARLYMMMGQKKLAEDAAEEFKRRIQDPRLLGHHERLANWLKAFPEKEAEVKKLQGKAAADPKDAASRWRLLDLYRYDYPRRLDELIGLMKFRQR